MAFRVKVEYGGKRFATFLLENVSYDVLVSNSIRLRYQYGECLSSRFFFFFFFCVLAGKASYGERSERPRLQENNHSSLRNWLSVPAQNEATAALATGDELRCLEPKQLSYHASTFPSASFTEEASASPTSAQNDQQVRSPLDSKQQEMKFSLTVLKV